MAEPLRAMRRAATQFAVRQSIAASAVLPAGFSQAAVRSLVAAAGSVPMLRSRVRDNMRLALGNEAPAGAEHSYFRHVGWLLSNALVAFHRGIAATPVPQQARFDQSIRVLDEAVAEGRGAVLMPPHWAGHEIASAAIINRRHPMTMLVRQAQTPERTARKLKWYGALGTETVLRPMQASTIRDAVAYLNVLKRGKVLGVTPDLLAGPGEGIEVRIFGRPARIHAGAFAISIIARAPMIRCHVRWQSDSCVTLMFERAPLACEADDRDTAIRAAAQDWCRWFEEKLRAHPENWLFWLDRRWSSFLRSVPRTPGGA